MKILGITAEYDPFHKGHSYHLESAKATAGPDATICVMSGDITQRGHAAVLDKWTRAEIALKHGLDMVLELPFLYAVSPAKTFARGAVDILVGAGATHISYGCEAEEPEKLQELACLQISEEDELEDIIRREMESGLSHVKARQIASEKVLGEELTWLSLSPNNILAIEYLKRMKFWEDMGVKLEAVPVLRKGSGYKDIGEEEDRDMAGGSAIRTMIEAGWDVSRFLPYDQSSLTGPDDEGRAPWTDIREVKRRMLEQLKGIVIRSEPAALADIRFVGEGIENRLVREVIDAEDFDGLLKKMTSKRYTTSTIRRMLIHILMGVGTEQADRLTGAGLYGRILALGERGRKLAGGGSLPFIANINKIGNMSEEIKESVGIDVKASDLYNLLTGRSMYENSDHRKKPVMG